MLRIEKKKKQQQEAAARETAGEAERNKNPTKKITYFDSRLKNTTRKKRDRNGFHNFPRRVLTTLAKRSRGAAISTLRRRSLMTRLQGGPKKAEQGSKRNYTQKHIQRSPSLVVLWGRKNNPRNNKKCPSPPGRSVETPKGS